MQNKTTLEKVAGSTVTESALTYIAALLEMALGAPLPVLSNALAKGRHEKRLQAAFKQINELLQDQANKIKTLSDGQYKLINETALAFWQTADPKKLRYLKNAIKNTINTDKKVIDDGVFLSRAIRDISAAEADFLIRNFKYKQIEIGNSSSEMPDHVLKVISNSTDELICSGLISLGLIVPSGPTFDDQGLWRFSGLVGKLIVLLQD